MFDYYWKETIQRVSDTCRLEVHLCNAAGAVQVGEKHSASSSSSSSSLWWSTASSWDHHHKFGDDHHLADITIALMISILSKIHNIPVTRAINMKSWKMKRHRVIVIMIDFHLTQINIWSLIRSAANWDEMIDLEGLVQKRLLHKCVDSFFFSLPKKVIIEKLIRSAAFWDEMIDLLQSWKIPVQRRLHHKCVVDISIFFPLSKLIWGKDAFSVCNETFLLFPLQCMWQMQ